MYNNIGGKIKGSAMVIAFIEGIVAFISGASIILLSEDIAYVGVMVMIIGVLIAYISSWLLYGYGELIEKTSEICKALNTGTTSNTQAIKHDSKIAKTFGVQGVMNIPKRESEDIKNAN